MTTAPDPEQYDSFEEWITAFAEASDADPFTLVGELSEQLEPTEE